MRRGGYIVATQRRGELDDNDASDYSQDDGDQSFPTPYESYTTTKYTRSSSRDKPSGIPRPGSHNSRPPSAMKAPRNQTYNSSSSTDSSTTNENVPPVPQIPQARSRSGTPGIGYDSYTTRTDHPHNPPPSGLSHRASSASRSRSRASSRSGYVDTVDPPPLPGSNSDSDGARAIEKTPKRASWAKDRRRFADPAPTSDPKDNVSESLGGGSRYDQPPTPVGRRSSLKPPSNFKTSVTPTSAPAVPSRIPSISTKAAREDTKSRPSSERDTSSRNSSRTNPSVRNTEDSKTPQVPSRRESSQIRTSHVSRINDTSRSEPAKQMLSSTSNATTRTSSRMSSAHSKVGSDEAKEQREQVTISSRHDAQLPVSPFAQSNTTTGNRTPRESGNEGATQPETVSSPVETMLIGAAPAAQTNETPESRRMSTPIRSTRESSVYVPPTPVASSATGNRRLSEPSPSKVTPSTKSQPPAEKEAPPTILQRLARRASLSTSKSPKIAAKSPKASTTPKSWLDVDHNDEELPFDLELETPRAATGTSKNAGTKGTPDTHQGLSDRQKNRQSSVPQSTGYLEPIGDESGKARPKVIGGVSGVGESRLGSPFMGDGSPRFGIDERFRSPKQRTKSSLRYDAFEPDDDRSQELLDYYGHGIVEPVNTANYYIEGLPVGTVLSSPGNMSVDQTPKGATPSSPMTQGKKRSQYHYTSRTRPSAAGSSINQQGPGDSMGDSYDDFDTGTPNAKSSSFPPPPIITRTSVTSLDTSTHSEFSDASDQESDNGDYLRTNVRQEDSRSATECSGRRTPTLVRFASQLTQNELDQGTSRIEHSTQPSRDKPKSGAPSLKTAGVQHGKRVSQLPVPRQRKTNSALFRALEQPYDSSSSMTEELNSIDEAKTGSDYVATEAFVGDLHTVSSISSSLDGGGVGSIRWSDAQELSGAAEALFHNIERSHPGDDTRPLIVDSSNGFQSDAIDGSAHEVDQTDGMSYSPCRVSPLHRSSGHYQDDYEERKRMSIVDKRKAIHESWRASLEPDQFQHLQETYDPLELHRQELIWEFHESERDFVDTLRILVHFFIQPLRTQDQRHWIAGLSPDIMKLLDWLDDIANLHEQLLDSLEAMRQDHDQVIILFSETIQPFVPLMELYQPYIVRVEETNKQINSMVLDPQSDFGEFVRIQSALPECGLSLEELTMKPISRLREYVPFFQTLLSFTPRTHPDHLPCFSVLHFMHATVCVLDEVKVREEEYELLKSLLARVTGLPPQFTIATRENRLLAQGPLTRIYFCGDDQPRGKANTVSHQPGVFPAGRSRTRSGSQSTVNSSTTESTSSYRSTSSSNPRLKDSSTDYSMRSDSSATIPVKDRRDDKPGIITHGSGTPRFRPRTPSTSQAEEIEIYALVFTDYVILAKGIMGKRRSRSPWRHPNEQWATFEALGVFRTLGVTDYRGRYGYEYLISLDLVPIGDTCLDDIDASVFVSIPHRAQKAPGDTQEFQKVSQEWFRSFQQCYLHTLRSISFTTQHEDSSSSRDHPRSSSLVPKSPSQQLEREVKRKEARLPPVGNAEGEREERGFWARRFKEVSKEMERAYEGISRALAPEALRYRPQSSRMKFRSSGTFV